MNKTVRKTLYTIVVIAVSLVVTSLLIASRKPPQRRPAADLRPTVATVAVLNDNIRIEIPVIGRLTAREHIRVYAEVSGVLEISNKPFLEGASYKKGEPLLEIQSEEAELNVMSQRSSLLMQLTQLLADLKFEYPQSYSTWEAYLIQYRIDRELAPLPEPQDGREKLFVAAKGIYQTYYSIKSQESRLRKYTLYAPFDGTVIASNIKPGSLVMNGQNLGELINTASYDLEAQVSLADFGYVNVGDVVELEGHGTTGNLVGTVSRINQNLDQTSQMVNVYITVSDESLKEGQYLEGRIKTSSTVRAVALPRKLITNKQSVFLVENDVIREQPVTVVTTAFDQAIITGLNNGDLVTTKTQSLYSGMKVKTL